MITDKVYNINSKQYIFLDEGEEFCPKCRGRGRIIKKSKGEKPRISLICSTCYGMGKLDWVEKVVGKKSVWSII